MSSPALIPASSRRKTPRGRRLRAAEFFAGIGLVRLALEGIPLVLPQSAA
jgi:hypothetical protein